MGRVSSSWIVAKRKLGRAYPTIIGVSLHTKESCCGIDNFDVIRTHVFQVLNVRAMKLFRGSNYKVGSSSVTNVAL